MIQGKDIIKSYEDLQVLKGVDIDITKGEIVSIIGKSGAGKSTLLHIVGTLDHSDAGTIVINGVDTTRLNKKNLAKFRNETIGFVFQFHHLLNEFTALENVTIPAHIQGTNATEAEKKAKELLDYLGLGDRMEHKPQELSGGEQQRVAIARSMLNEPELIIADEPTGNLDPETSSEIISLFQKLNKIGTSMIIATHDYDLILNLEGQVYKCEEGSIFEVKRK